MVVACVGQCCFDRLALVSAYPAPDEKVEVSEWKEDLGGPAATAAVALRKLGVDAAFYGIRGSDQEGAQIRNFLDSADVNHAGLHTREGGVSQSAFIVIDQRAASRTIFWRRCTGAELMVHEVRDIFTQGITFLHLDGLMEGASMLAASQARERQIPVMFDAGRVRAKTLEIARLCDFFVGSEFCARQLGYGSADFEKQVAGIGAKVITFTFGEKGSITFTGGDYFETPAFPVTAVDTTGAGDVFHGAYIYGILQQWRLPEVVQFASAAAALSCTRIGSASAAPTLTEVHELLKSQ